MPKKGENVSESQKPSTPELPNFLVVGTPSRATMNGGMSLGEERLRKLLNWYDLATPQLKESGHHDLGVPAVKLALELGMKVPKNGNSFRASLQHQLDQVSVDGRTVYLALRGAGEKFEVTDETMIWFHPVSPEERNATKVQRKAGEVGVEA